MQLQDMELRSLSANLHCSHGKKLPRMIMEKTGATLVHPYDNFNVICGQGTAALELLG